MAVITFANNTLKHGAEDERRCDGAPIVNKLQNLGQNAIQLRATIPKPSTPTNSLRPPAK